MGCSPHGSAVCAVLASLDLIHAAPTSRKAPLMPNSHSRLTLTTASTRASSVTCQQGTALPLDVPRAVRTPALTRDHSQAPGIPAARTEFYGHRKLSAPPGPVHGLPGCLQRSSLRPTHGCLPPGLYLSAKVSPLRATPELCCVQCRCAATRTAPATRQMGGGRDAPVLRAPKLRLLLPPPSALHDHARMGRRQEHPEPAGPHLC